MSTRAKPLPDVNDPLTAPHWAALRQDQLVLQECAECQYLRWPPAPLCPECLCPQAHWQQIAPCGELWSYATYHRPLDPAFSDEVPYSVGLIQLDAGPRMLGKILAPTKEIGVGSRVRGVFDEVTPQISLLRWRLSARNQ